MALTFPSDVVDWEPANGNFQKIILGSIHADLDAQQTPSEHSEHSEKDSSLDDEVSRAMPPPPVPVELDATAGTSRRPDRSTTSSSTSTVTPGKSKKRDSVGRWLKMYA